LIAAGHRSDDVWNYTPRQLAAYGFIAEKRRTRERAEALTIGVMASRGDLKTVKKQLKEWSRE
jgi:hypothetical protein